MEDLYSKNRERGNAPGGHLDTSFSAANYLRRLARTMAARERISLHQWCINRPASEASSSDVRKLFLMLSPPLAEKCAKENLPHFQMLISIPKALGFPVNVQKTRTRIPRRAFIKWMEGGGEW